MAKEKSLTNQAGFTLIEVMISLSIFAVFIVAFVGSIGQNYLDSGKIKREQKLKDLAQNKINEVLAAPPELRHTLTLGKDEGVFDSDNNYSYVVQFKSFTVPDLNKLKEAKSDENPNPNKAMLEKAIANNFKENLEKLLWQLEVTVKEKDTGETLVLSTWLYNQDAKVQIKI